MAELGSTYSGVLAGWVVLAGLVLLQAVVADVAAIRAKHTPGMPVTSGHDDFLFRAVRAHSNTIENLSLFALLSLGAMLLGVAPATARNLVWAFVASRVLHMAAYYSDQRLLRSGAFTLGFVALAGLFVTACAALA